jgi:hypothetical protein
VLAKLLKFVIRTRFSRPLLILIAVMLVYYSAISTLIPPQQANTILGYYGTAIVALFLAMALAAGGIMIYKSDRDYLFALPLSTRDLSIAIFFSQFIAFGISILFMFAYLDQTLASPLLLLDLVALALTFTSLGVISPSMTTRLRLALSVGLALWTLAGFEKFPLSPGATFNGNPLGGTVTTVALAAVTTTLAFRGLSRIELDMMRSLVRTTASEIKSPNSYVGKSPIGAIYSMNLSNMSLAGRMNMAGTSRYVSRRVKTRWVVLTASAAAAAYFAYAILSGAPAAAVNGTDTFPGAIIVAVLLAFISFFLSQSAITNERVWLSLTSLPPATYFRHLIASRVISLFLILAPFAAANLVLLAMGYGTSLGALGVILAVIPGSYVLEICWAAYIAPIQVKGDDMTMVAQFSLRQLATALPLGGVIILVSLASIIPLVAIAGGLVLCVISALLTMSGAFWTRVLTKLTEQGFV